MFYSASLRGLCVSAVNVSLKSGIQAHILTSTRDGRTCVLKSPRRGLLKFFTRWTLEREARVYERLAGVKGVPACFGLTHEGLWLESIDGRPLSEFRKGQVSAGFLDDLDRIIAAIHARGVVHSDLKKRANVLVVEKPGAGSQKPEESIQRPVILDFGAAFLQGELLFETFRRIDLAAAAKLRAHHQPETLRPEQRTLLDSPTWAERLSRFLIHTIRDPFRRIIGHV